MSGIKTALCYFLLVFSESAVIPTTRLNAASTESSNQKVSQERDREDLKPLKIHPKLKTSTLLAEVRTNATDVTQSDGTTKSVSQSQSDPEGLGDLADLNMSSGEDVFADHDDSTAVLKDGTITDERVLNVTSGLQIEDSRNTTGPEQSLVDSDSFSKNISSNLFTVNPTDFFVTDDEIELIHGFELLINLSTDTTNSLHSPTIYKLNSWTEDSSSEQALNASAKVAVGPSSHESSTDHLQQAKSTETITEGGTESFVQVSNFTSFNSSNMPGNQSSSGLESNLDRFTGSNLSTNSSSLLQDISTLAFNENSTNFDGLGSQRNSSAHVSENSSSVIETFPSFNVSNEFPIAAFTNMSQGTTIPEFIRPNATHPTTISSVDFKCPPPGICIFWFMADDTCALDIHCPGTGRCCKIRCSKTCVDEEVKVP